MMRKRRKSILAFIDSHCRTLRKGMTKENRLSLEITWAKAWKRACSLLLYYAPSSTFSPGRIRLIERMMNLASASCYPGGNNANFCVNYVLHPSVYGLWFNTIAVSFLSDYHALLHLSRARIEFCNNLQSILLVSHWILILTYRDSCLDSLSESSYFICTKGLEQQRERLDVNSNFF